MMFDSGGLLNAVVPVFLTLGAGAAVYFVRSSAASSVDDRSKELIGRMDALRDSISTLNTTIGISQERTASQAEKIKLLDDRMAQDREYSHSAYHRLSNALQVVEGRLFLCEHARH